MKQKQKPVEPTRQIIARLEPRQIHCRLGKGLISPVLRYDDRPRPRQSRLEFDGYRTAHNGEAYLSLTECRLFGNYRRDYEPLHIRVEIRATPFLHSHPLTLSTFTNATSLETEIYHHPPTKWRRQLGNLFTNAPTRHILRCFGATLPKQPRTTLHLAIIEVVIDEEL